MLSNWIDDLLRGISLFFDNIFYSLIPILYNLFVGIAETTIFSEELFLEFASRIYALLGIFMLFKVSFSLLSYIVNPNEFNDKSKGASKLIVNIIISLALLVATPWLFNQAMEIQRIILKDNTLGKIFTSVSSDNAMIVSPNPGANVSYDILRAFYSLDDSYSACEGLDTLALEEDAKAACEASLSLEGGEFAKLDQTLTNAYVTKSSSIYLDSEVAYMRDSVTDRYVMEYMPFVSALVAAGVCWLFILFCFDIALRSVKLGFYRLIAPIPIISRLDPKKGTKMFDDWVKSVVNTYLDLFIRLLAVYFAIYIISNLSGTFVNSVTGLEEEINGYVYVFIVFGALMFAKQLPKIITDLTGYKMDGKFTLNPLKKLSEVPGVEKLASVAGGTVAGAKAGASAGNPLLGAALGAGHGFKNSKLAGDGNAGFFKTAKSAHKSLTGNDLMNFQWKPGGEAAIKKIGDPLKELYKAKDELAQKMSDTRLKTENSANILIKNGVNISDVSSDSVNLAQQAVTNYNNLEEEIRIAEESFGTSDYDAHMTEQLRNQLNAASHDIQKYRTMATEGANYLAAREEEMNYREISSSLEKDISGLQKEKQQRENFYGMDPAPRKSVDRSIKRANVEGGQGENAPSSLTRYTEALKNKDKK